MACYQRFMNVKCKCAKHVYSYPAFKEGDLEYFETSEEKINYLVERCKIQEKERKLLDEDLGHLERELNKLEMKAHHADMENLELDYQCKQLKNKNFKLEAEKDEFEQALFREKHAKNGGKERDANLLSSARRRDYQVQHGNHSAKVSNDEDLKAQLKFVTEKANYLENLIVRKLALAEQASRQTSETPMTSGVVRSVTVARVLPDGSPPAQSNNNETPPAMNANAAEDGDQVVPSI